MTTLHVFGAVLVFMAGFITGGQPRYMFACVLCLLGMFLRMM